MQQRNMPRSLHVAAASGNLIAIKELLEQKVDINLVEQNRFGNSAVGLAAQAGHVEVVDYLLSQKAELDFNKQGKHPIHLAAEQGHFAVIKLLDEKYKIDLGLETQNKENVVRIVLKNRHYQK